MHLINLSRQVNGQMPPVFSHGGHGLCLANKTYARTEEEVQPDIAQWTELAMRWMERISG